MYLAYKLNKQGDNIQPWRTPFPVWNQSLVPCPVLTVASWPSYRFLKRQVRCSDIPISFSIFHSFCFPVLCKFWQLYGGVMVTSSKRAYAIPTSTALTAPAPAAVHCWFVPPQETLRQSSGSVSVGSLGPGVHICSSSLSISGGYGVWF